jgi:hypothetical protein
MGILRKRNKSSGVSVQIRSRDSHPFAPLDDYVPLKKRGDTPVPGDKGSRPSGGPRLL